MEKNYIQILMVTFCFLLPTMHNAQSNEQEARKILYRKELKLYENETGNNLKAYISKFNTLREKSLKDNDWEVATDCLYHKRVAFTTSIKVTVLWSLLKKQLRKRIIWSKIYQVLNGKEVALSSLNNTFYFGFLLSDFGNK